MLFDGGNLFQPPAMALFTSKVRTKKMDAEIFRQFRSDHSGAKHKHVHIIVLHALVGRVGVVAKARANAGNLVGGHGCAHAAAANEDATFGLAMQNAERQRLGEVGIIYRISAVRTRIYNRMALPAQKISEQLFEFKAGMVRCEGDPHCSLYIVLLPSAFEQLPGGGNNRLRRKAEFLLQLLERR